MYVMGCPSCINTAPRLFKLGSTEIFVGLFGSKNFNTGASMLQRLKTLLLVTFPVPFFFSSNFCRRDATCDKLGINLAK